MNEIGTKTTNSILEQKQSWNGNENNNEKNEEKKSDEHVNKSQEVK